MKLIKTTMTGYEYIIDYLDPSTREIKYEVVKDGENGFWKETDEDDVEHYKFKNGSEIWVTPVYPHSQHIKNDKGFEIVQDKETGEHVVTTYGLERRTEYNLRMVKLSSERKKDSGEPDGEVKLFVVDIEEDVNIEPFTFDW